MKMVELLPLKVRLLFNPIALRTAKTLWSFDCSECNRVKIKVGMVGWLVVLDLTTCSLYLAVPQREGERIKREMIDEKKKCPNNPHPHLLQAQ